MKKTTPYTLYLNTVRGLRGTRSDSEYEGCDELLAYLHDADIRGQIVSMNDLVYTRDFGTSPTIQRKVKSLNTRGFVEVKRIESDKRARIVAITPKGVAHLEDQSRFIQKIFRMSEGN